jgi:AcrR family transcriptional regulator
MFKTFVLFMKAPATPPEARILDVAEQLFAKQGFDRTSMRQLTVAAGMNVAAVNYHFGDKEALYAAMITRRLRPLNQARLAALEQAEREAGGQPVPVARIIEILVRPVFELSQDESRGGPSIMRIVGRSLAEPLPFMDAILAAEFQPTMARFGQAVRRSVPQLSPEDFLWRLSFVYGAMQHTFSMLHRMSEFTRGICRNDDHEGALRRFIEFAVSAFSAPGAKL